MQPYKFYGLIKQNRPLPRNNGYYFHILFGASVRNTVGPLATQRTTVTIAGVTASWSSRPLAPKKKK